MPLKKPLPLLVPQRVRNIPRSFAWIDHRLRTPTEIRERYRKRFGIEASYRQRRQARIYTCTRNPHLRLVFVAISP